MAEMKEMFDSCFTGVRDLLQATAQEFEYFYAQLVELGVVTEARCHRLWKVCGKDAQNLLDILDAFSWGVLSRADFERVLAGSWSASNVYSALAHARAQYANEPADRFVDDAVAICRGELYQ